MHKFEYDFNDRITEQVQPVVTDSGGVKQITRTYDYTVNENGSTDALDHTIDVTVTTLHSAY